VDEGVIERAKARIGNGWRGKAEAESALERFRTQLEDLAQSAAELEATLPERIGDAVRDGLRAEALPVARQLAETRGLSAQVIRRLERIEGDLAAERHARVDDLALLVDLIAGGWKDVSERLARLEQALSRPA
jgi:hypothetical protein